MSESEESRDHEPTAKKLEDARSRGDIVHSADLTSACAVSGLVAAAILCGPWSLVAFGERASNFLDMMLVQHPDKGVSADLGLARWAFALLLPLLPYFGLPVLAASLSLAVQRAVVFSSEKLMPKLERVDPIANARNKFGRSGIAQFTKSFIKMAAVGAVLAWFIIRQLPDILLSLQLPAIPASALLLHLTSGFMALVAGISILIGGADYLWQWLEHRRRNRMSHQEIVEEYKDSEGDPHLKGKRRQRAQEIAMNRMLADVPKADVVVVNPTHYAVALRWNRGSGRAPFCIAKGTDEIARRIREAAALAGVPIHSDPPTARALHASVELGREIRPEHYAAVAAAIRYAEKMRKRAIQRGVRQ